MCRDARSAPVSSLSTLASSSSSSSATAHRAHSRPAPQAAGAPQHSPNGQWCSFHPGRSVIMGPAPPHLPSSQRPSGSGYPRIPQTPLTAALAGRSLSADPQEDASCHLVPSFWAQHRLQQADPGFSMARQDSANLGGPRNVRWGSSRTSLLLKWSNPPFSPLPAPQCWCPTGISSTQLPPVFPTSHPTFT